MGVARFQWSLASPSERSVFVPLTGHDGPNLQSNPARYVPGDTFDVRVDALDRIDRKPCNPSNRTCSQRDDVCSRRRTWTVDPMMRWLLIALIAVAAGCGADGISNPPEDAGPSPTGPSSRTRTCPPPTRTSASMPAARSTRRRAARSPSASPIATPVPATSTRTPRCTAPPTTPSRPGRSCRS